MTSQAQNAQDQSIHTSTSNQIHTHSVSALGAGQPAAESASGATGAGGEQAPSPQGGGVRDLANLDRKTAREKASSPYPKLKPDKTKTADSSAADKQLIDELSSFLPESKSSPIPPEEEAGAAGGGANYY